MEQSTIAELSPEENRRKRWENFSEEWASSEKRVRRRKRLLIASVPVLAGCVAAFFVAVNIAIPAMHYQNGMTALEDEDLETAYVQFCRAGEYKDSPERSASLLAEHPAVAQVGDVIVYGSYEQDNNPDNGTEPLEWIVLSKDEEGTALVVSRYCLFAEMYDDAYEETDWEHSLLREKLNGDFLEKTFDFEQRQRILSAPVENPSNPTYQISGGKKTVDKIFLLSLEQAQQGFGSEDARIAYSTDSLTASDPSPVPFGNYSWWLRTPGNNGAHACYVKVDGSLDDFGTYVNNKFGVRPAMCLTLPE